MKPLYKATILFVVFLSLTLVSFNWKDLQSKTTETTMQQDSVLRHVVMFKFKEGTSKEDEHKVQKAFSALPSKIPQIQSYDWGINNSPEGLDKGFTHIFLLTFNSEADRAIYLPHPDHKAFGDILHPYLEDVMVMDYWSHQK